MSERVSPLSKVIARVTIFSNHSPDAPHCILTKDKNLLVVLATVSRVVGHELEEARVALELVEHLDGLGDALVSGEGVVGELLGVLADGDAQGVDDERVGKLLHALGPRRREHQRLALLRVRAEADDGANILNNKEMQKQTNKHIRNTFG